MQSALTNKFGSDRDHTDEQRETSTIDLDTDLHHEHRTRQMGFSRLTKETTVNLLVLSDLHIEFADFSLDVEAVQAADVVVLAGDIGSGWKGLEWARRSVPDKPVVYVCGNHELYGWHWLETLEEMRDVAGSLDINFLENDEVSIDEVRFLGASLWTDFEYFGSEYTEEMMRHAQNGLNDFRRIWASQGSDRQLLTPAMTLERHRVSRAWLEGELAGGDPERTVVVTHHYPHRDSTAAQFVDDDLTAAFGSHLPTQMLTRSALWIHGHTHSSCNYMIEHAGRQTRVLCNPRGYPRGRSQSFENAEFDPSLIVTLMPSGQTEVRA